MVSRPLNNADEGSFKISPVGSHLRVAKSVSQAPKPAQERRLAIIEARCGRSVAPRIHKPGHTFPGQVLVSHLSEPLAMHVGVEDRPC